MKKQIEIVSFLLLLFVCFYACRKDETIKSLTNNYNNLKDNIIIGSEPNMFITAYDTIIDVKYVQSTFFDIDLNKDGIVDFRFSTMLTAPRGAAYAKISALVECKNASSMLYGVEKNDTTFLHSSTSQDTLTSGKPRITTSTFYTCSKMDVNDAVNKVIQNQFVVLPLKLDEKLSRQDFFKSDSNDLNGNHSAYNHTRTSGDTTYVTYISNNHTCNAFPQTVVNYIGIKYNDRLGWLKLIIDNRNLKVQILEIAVQK